MRTVEQEIFALVQFLCFREFSADRKNLTRKYFSSPLIVYTLAARNAKIYFHKIYHKQKCKNFLFYSNYSEPDFLNLDRHRSIDVPLLHTILCGIEGQHCNVNLQILLASV